MSGIRRAGGCCTFLSGIVVSHRKRQREVVFVLFGCYLISFGGRGLLFGIGYRPLTGECEERGEFLGRSYCHKDVLFSFLLSFGKAEHLGGTSR